jgi:hypothetical protein
MPSSPNREKLNMEPNLTNKIYSSEQCRELKPNISIRESIATPEFTFHNLLFAFGPSIDHVSQAYPSPEVRNLGVALNSLVSPLFHTMHKTLNAVGFTSKCL